jgi:hypothetical protein
MLNKRYYQQQAIQAVAYELKDIFEGSKEYYLEHPGNSFKVRPGYGYDKFYLDWVAGSYDMSLQALIHFILFERNWFRKFLSPETYKKLAPFMKRNPEYLYDFGENEEEREMVDEIEWCCINYVRWLFKNFGLDDSAFVGEGYNSEPQLSHISKSAIFYHIVVDGDFFYDLKYYLEEHDLSQKDLTELLEIAKKSYEVNEILRMIDAIAQKHTEAAKEMMRECIHKVEKNSQYTALSNVIKKRFNNEAWADEVIALKNR